MQRAHLRPTPPPSPELGDLWIDTNDCPPSSLHVWDDCDDPTTHSWTPIVSVIATAWQANVAIVSNNSTELGSTLTAIGGNGADAGTALQATATNGLERRPALATPSSLTSKVSTPSLLVSPVRMAASSAQSPCGPSPTPMSTWLTTPRYQRAR